MGRWSFQGGRPLYIPDPGEEGGGSLLGHLASGLGQTAEDAFGALMNAPVTPVMGGPKVSDVLNAGGVPARAVTATGHALDPAGYQGTTDPIDYILTGEKNDPSDLAHYGNLLADTMEAEGTIKEGSAASWVIRKAGEAISDPLVLAGVAEMAVRPAAAAPPRAPVRAATPSTPKVPKVRQTRYRHPPVDPAEAARFPSAPLDRDLASPGAFTRGGVQPFERATGKAPKPPKKKGPWEGEPPMDRDLVYAREGERGGVRSFDAQMKKADRKGRQTRQATRDMRQEQLREGTAKMRQEQLDEGTAKMRQEQLDEGAAKMRQEQLDEGAALMRREQMVPPRSVIGEFMQAAVENGASPQDVLNILLNLGG